jgi:hypothetical protein
MEDNNSERMMEIKMSHKELDFKPFTCNIHRLRNSSVKVYKLKVSIKCTLTC